MTKRTFPLLVVVNVIVNIVMCWRVDAVEMPSNFLDHASKSSAAGEVHASKPEVRAESTSTNCSPRSSAPRSPSPSFSDGGDDRQPAPEDDHTTLSTTSADCLQSRCRASEHVARALPSNTTIVGDCLSSSEKSRSVFPVALASLVGPLKKAVLNAVVPGYNLPVFSQTEVAKHNTLRDCWMSAML